MNIRRILAIMAAIGLILTAMYVKDSAKAQTNTITLTAKLTIKAGKEKEFETLMKGVVPKVRQEPGNINYIMCRSKENPRLFMFLEEYADQKAIQAHGQHLKELGLNFSEFLDGPVAAEYFDKIAQ
jgi:quinol monooxygenase YgiN